MARIKLNRFDEAIDDCTKALDMNPDYSKAMSRRAMSRHKKGMYLLAVKDYRDALKMNNTKKQISSLRALMYRSRDKLYEVEGLEASKMLLDAGMSELRKESRKANVKSTAYTRLCIDESESSEDEEQDEENEYVKRGDVCLREKKFNDAFQEFEKALNQSSRRADAYIGRAKARLGRKDKKVEDIELIVRDCCVALAVLSTTDKKYQEMRRSALLVRAESRIALYEVKASMRLLNEAEMDLRKILEIECDNVEALNMLNRMALAAKSRGNEHFKKGRLVESIAEYEKSLSLDPSLTASRTNLAMAYSRSNDWNAVLRTCRDVLELKKQEIKSSHRVKLLFRAGEAYLKLDKMEASLKMLRSALKIEPDNIAVKNLLSKIKEEKYNSANTTSVSKINVMDDSSSRIQSWHKNSKEKESSSKVSSNSAWSTPPKSSYEFRRAWKSLKQRDLKEKYAYVKILKPRVVKKIFGKSLEPEILSELISTVHGVLKTTTKQEEESQSITMKQEILTLLESLASLNGFPMAMILMSDSNTTGFVNSIFHSLLEGLSNMALRRKIETLRERYLSHHN